MKKYLIVTLVLVLALSVSGLALAENKATVSQEGARNIVAVDQETGDNTASVNQEGNDHLALVRQGGDPDKEGRPSTTWALIDQEGLRNIAVADQDGAHYPYYGNQMHVLIIEQDGKDNYADIKQTTTYHGAVARIEQLKERNIGVIRQNGNQFPDIEKGKGWAVISQDGYDNIAHQDQISYVNDGHMKATIEQYGNRNIASQTQTHHFTGNVPKGEVRIGVSAQIGGFVAYVYQDGKDNNAIQMQNAGFGTRVGSVVQDGDRNLALQTQGPGFHTAYIVQTGDDNVARIDQFDNTHLTGPKPEK